MRGHKLPLQRGTVSFTHARILDEIKKRGYALPCHITAVRGPIVNVSFDVEGVALPGDVPIPTYGSKYVRQPYQVDDEGFTFPMAVDVSGLVGLGTGIPAMVLPANFSALFWFPSPDVAWDSVDPDVLVLSGPKGVILQDLEGHAVVTVDKTDGITLSFGGKTVTLKSEGLRIDGILFDTHEHTGVTSGSDKSLGPVNP